jgi:hypothetical protein
MLNEQRGELGLGYDGELRVCAANIAFPVRVLSRIGRWKVGGEFKAV